MSDYERGYEAGLNGWKYELEYKDNKFYNSGWKKDWEKRRALENAYHG